MATNKVIVLSHSEKGRDVVNGLGYKIISYEDFKCEQDTIYLCIGYDAFNVVNKSVHLGLRRIKWSKAVDLPRVGIKGDTSFIFTYEDDASVENGLKRLEDPNIDKCLIPELTDIEYVTTASRAKEVFDQWIADNNLFYGFDYESNGKDKNHIDFMLSGVGICTTKKGVWFDLRRMDDRVLFLSYLRDFLLKEGEKCVVFSVQFEYIATYNPNVIHEFINFIDLDVINVLQNKGNWNNLKWTARRLCNVNSWDDDFDSLSDDIGYYITENEDGTVTINYEELIKYLESDYNFDQSQIEEVKTYLAECPTGFYAIPMKILGKYCILDCYYTLWSWLIGCKQLRDWNFRWKFNDKILEDYNNNRIDESFYKTLKEQSDRNITLLYTEPEKVIKNKVYLGEIRELARTVISKVELGFKAYAKGKLLEARINHQGMIKDTKFYTKAVALGEKILLQSATSQVLSYYDYALKDIGEVSTDLTKYNKYTRRLIEQCVDVTLGGYKLSKYLFSDRYWSDKHEWYLNDNLVKEDFGDEIGNELIYTLWDYCDDNYDTGRKRKCHEVIGERLDQLIFKPADISDEDHTKVVNYFYYKKYRDQILNMPWRGLDIDQWPEKFTINGSEYTIAEALDYILTYVNVNSPTNKDHMYNESHMKHNLEFIYFYLKAYEMDTELVGRYPSDKVRESGEVITDFDDLIDKDFKFFSENFDELNSEAKEYTKLLYDNYYKAAYQIDHLFLISWMEKYYPGFNDWIVKESRLGNTHYGHASHVLFAELYYKLFTKYYKSIGTYFKGTFYSGDVNYSSLDENWMSDFDYHDWNYNNPTKSFAEYEAFKQYSLRWSSGYHTVPSRSEVKKCMSSPPDGLLSYFDISSMEVRTAVYLSKDPAMLNDFESGVDAYINISKMAFPDYSIEDHYEMRPVFKTVLLGKLYGRGNKSIAEALMMDPSETERFSNHIEARSPVLFDFIEQKASYPANHDYYLDTEMGEMIETDDGGGIDRRHGINTVIQGFSANLAAYGFENILEAGRKEGIRVAPVAIVHDSVTNIFDIQHLWDIHDFYYRNFTQFIYDLRQIRFLFDVKLGTNYFDVCTLGVTEDPKVITLKGTGQSINQILDKLDLNNIKYKCECDKLVNGRLPEIKIDPIRTFIDEAADEPIYDKDLSKYKVTLIKL
jgi:hypothetical protein